MPIYEYRCTACRHELEALQKFSDAPLVLCPKCGQEALTKLVSAAGFQLKGSGWYQTDFRSSGSKPPPKTDAAAEGKSEGKSDGKSDGKQAQDKKGDGSTSGGDSPVKTPAAKGESAKGESAKTETTTKPTSAPPAST